MRSDRRAILRLEEPDSAVGVIGERAPLGLGREREAQRVVVDEADQVRRKRRRIAWRPSQRRVRRPFAHMPHLRAHGGHTQHRCLEHRERPRLVERGNHIDVGA